MQIRRFALLFVALSLLIWLCAPAATAQATELTPLQTKLLESCTYGKGVSLQFFNVNHETLKNTFVDMETNGLLPWYTSGSFQYSYEETNNTIILFTPEYINDGNIDQSLYEQKIAQILHECVLEGMSQHQIALSIHDYLAVSIAYDETLEKKTSYDGLINGTTVCAGYAKLYQDLLQRAGIDCKYVVSEKMNHGWNIVNIDGQWYHVDLTWDDPTPDTHGSISHSFFLVTDEQISSSEEPHYDWNCDIACTDTRFTNAFWRDVESRICYESSSTCYLVRTDDYTNSIYRRDESTGKETKIYTEGSNYTNVGSGNYKYWHQGLSFQNGRLYLSSLDKLVSMDTNGANTKTEYTHNTRGSGRYIQGSFISGSNAYLSASDHDGNIQNITVSLSVSGGHTHSFTVTKVPADCLEDGYTLSQCECGLQAKSDPVKATDHSYSLLESQDATLFQDGQSVWKCDNCENTYTEEYPQLSLTGLIEDNLSYIIGGGAFIVVFLSKVFRSKKKTKV